MVALFVIFGALLGACGVGLVGLGIGMLAEGQGAGVVGIVCGLPVCYGAYLFGRAAFRTRRDLQAHPLKPEQRRSRRARVRFVLVYTVSLIVGAVALPGPTPFRVLMAAFAVLVVPVILAGEFEPPKRHQPPAD